MKKIISTCLIFMLSLLLFVSPGFALSAKKTMEVTYNNIQLIINGIRVVPRDVNGTVVEPFIYNGTTYLPIRAVSEALGKSVEWDGATQTVYVSDRPILNIQEQGTPLAQTPQQTPAQPPTDIQQPSQTNPPTEPSTQTPADTQTGDTPEDTTQTEPSTQNPTTPDEETATAPVDAHSIIVYVSNSSDTIHSVYNCSGMKNYREMTLAEAREISSAYCSKCAGHLKEE
ncbi:MAG: stalk domain-containing protein [Clostridiales bacterium]|nr:stalk domain-containing protein [Clostridiales bacterium]